MRSSIVLVLTFFWLPTFAAAREPFEMPLWNDTPPGPASSLQETHRDPPVTDGTQVARDRHVRGVATPELTVYLPDVPNRSRASVVVLPGGGFHVLAIDKEGHDVAAWLNQQGIAAIVVKYRLPDPSVGLHVYNGSLPDVRRAVRVVRAQAKEWNLDPQRIGVTGFSAGGYLTAAVGTMYDLGDEDAADLVERQSCRPNFIAPIYPLISLGPLADARASLVERMLGPQPTMERRVRFSPEEQVTSETPPTFLVHATDDNLNAEHSVLFYLALKRAEVPVELHLYSRGGHGYGIRQRGEPVSSWPDRWLQWMRSEGIVASD